MADELDAFLKEGAQPADGLAQAEPEAATPEPPEHEPKASETPAEPAAKAQEAEPEDEDHDLAVSGSDGRTVPIAALGKVRQERNDWKSKAAAMEAEAKVLREQLEAAKRPPPAPAAPPQPVMRQLPDFNTNPQGYIHAMAEQHAQAMLNERLNLSEAMLRDKLGDEKVDQYQADFRKFAEQDPSLWPKLYNQPTPYQWLTKEIDRRRLHADIGDDPTAFEARIREKVLAEIAAAGNGNGPGGNGGQEPAPRGPGLPQQAPSLASARSVAGRTSPAFTGPPPMEQLFPGVENRRRAR